MKKVNNGLELYLKAKKNILGGTMLLSKKPELWLPKFWPTYFKRANKISVWDLNNKKYIDMICAVGQNTLGYAHKKIDDMVIKSIKKSNMTTLNCPEEVELSEILLKMNSWADKVKFARTGGEANSMAIRIARAASKKDNIAICGYHGWHDWYLAVNLTKKNGLKNHLLNGLKTTGVPKFLKNTTHPFEYGRIDQLKEIIKKKNIGIIKIEIARSSLPDKKFIKKVSQLAKKNKIILIFDECTSGFRRNFGGLYLDLGVKPDIVIYGKAIGNGYALTAVVGNKKVMTAASSCFISSTFWTERIGYVAAINTLKEMQRMKSWKILIKNGKHIITGLKYLAKKYNLNLKIEGIESIINFNFLSKYNIYYKTYIAQEMLKKGYLASNIMYVTIYHNEVVVNKYLKKLEPIFKKIESFERNKDVKKKLNGPACETGFGRLTN